MSKRYSNCLAATRLTSSSHQPELIHSPGCRPFLLYTQGFKVTSTRESSPRISMELTQFRVRNFRSVNDSGDIAVSKLTALVGRNESGKSNLLLALASLKPPKGFRPLSPIKDFPRGRRLQECTDDTHVVDTRWKLTKEESAELGEMLGPENEQITEVTVSRLYGKMRQVGLIGLKEARINEKSTRSTARRLGPVLSSFIEQIADANIKSHASAAWKRLNDSMQSINDEL